MGKARRLLVWNNYPCAELILFLSWLELGFRRFSYSMAAWSAALRGIRAPRCLGLQQPALSFSATAACHARIPLVADILTISVTDADKSSGCSFWKLLTVHTGTAVSHRAHTRVRDALAGKHLWNWKFLFRATQIHAFRIRRLSWL